mmetsp:Transcript_5073/g.6878  ORF Transcript_5073/g.6878 Transcript_5073/m.6878 type:complete len:83 (+) Transcript_5073:461-709(+)
MISSTLIHKNYSHFLVLRILEAQRKVAVVEVVVEVEGVVEVGEEEEAEEVVVEEEDSVVEWGVGAQVEEDLVAVVAEVDDIK